MIPPWCLVALLLNARDVPTTQSGASPPWPLPLHQAVRMALDHDERVRLIPESQESNRLSGPGADQSEIVVARVDADTSICRFEREIMALVRSVRLLYGKLYLKQVQLALTEAAIKRLDEVRKQEVAGLESGSVKKADGLAEVERFQKMQRLEETRLSWELKTAEQELRKLLGMPPDGRRIIAVSKPAQIPLDFDWDTCLGEMSERRPEIRERELMARLAEFQLIFARNQLIPLVDLLTLELWSCAGSQPDLAKELGNPWIIPKMVALFSAARAMSVSGAELPGSFINTQIGFTIPLPLSTRSPLANTRSAQYQLLRVRSRKQQLIHESTHTLARYFLKVQAIQRQLKSAARLRKTTIERVDDEGAAYREGKTLLHRRLEDISRSCSATATEAEYQQSYGDSILGLQEAKGTLLDDQGIVILVSKGVRVSPTFKLKETPEPAHSPFLATAWRTTPLEVAGHHRIRGMDGIPDRELVDALALKIAVWISSGTSQGRVWHSSTAWAVPPAPVYPGSLWAEIQ